MIRVLIFIVIINLRITKVILAGQLVYIIKSFLGLISNNCDYLAEERLNLSKMSFTIWLFQELLLSLQSIQIALINYFV